MKRTPLFDELILKSWWAILFSLLCFFAYDQAVKRRVREEQRLQRKYTSLQHAKREALMAHEDLILQLASQEDNAWIEMTLMRRLGLVPEGSTKVLFITKS